MSFVRSFVILSLLSFFFIDFVISILCYFVISLFISLSLYGYLFIYIFSSIFIPLFRRPLFLSSCYLCICLFSLLCRDFMFSFSMV